MVCHSYKPQMKIFRNKISPNSSLLIKLSINVYKLLDQQPWMCMSESEGCP